MPEKNFTVNGITIKELSGNLDEIVIVGADGKFSASGTTIADFTKNHFNPNVKNETDVTEDTPGNWELGIQKIDSNLIGVDVDQAVRTDFGIGILYQWTLSEVGTIRMDIVTHIGQTISFFSAVGDYMTINGLNDLILPANGIASIMFDKPFGTTAWYARQLV